MKSEHNFPLRNFIRSQWVPAFIGISAFVVTLLLWQNGKTNEYTNIRSRIELKTKSAQSIILTHVISQINGLVRMAKRFESFKNIPLPEWEADLRLYVKHFPAYQAVGWADSSAHIQWLVPENGNETLHGMDIFSGKKPPADGKTAMGNYDAGVTPIIELTDGEKGFFIHAPIFNGTGELTGYSVALVPLKRLLDDIVKNNVFLGTSVALYEHELEVYRQNNSKEALENPHGEAFVNFFGTSWRMLVYPTRQWLDEQNTSIPQKTLLLGTLMAFLLYLSSYFAQASHRQTVKAESALRELEGQTTLRRRTENALQESEEHYRNIMHLIPDMVYRLDQQGRFTYISPAAAHFGFTPEELIGKHFHEIVHPNDRHIAKFRFDERRVGERATRRAEFRLSPSSGTPKDCELNEVCILLSSVGVYKTGAKSAFLGTQGIIRDITEQKQDREQLRKAHGEMEQRVNARTEELRHINRKLHDEIKERQMSGLALQKSYRELAQAQQIAQIGSWVWNIKDNTLSWSDQIFRIFGMTPQQFKATYEAFLERVHPDDRAFVEKSVDDAINKKTPYSIDHRIVLSGGSIRLVHEQGEITYDEQGSPVEMAGTVQDITERKRVEGVLRKNHDDLSRAQRIGRIGNWSWDLESNRVSWSDQVYRIFGFTPGQVEPSYDLFMASVHPDDRAFVEKSIKDARSEKRPYNIVHRIVLPNGSIRVARVRSEEVYDDRGMESLIVGTTQDITEEHRIKTELENSKEQLRNLYGHLESVREEEKTRIAREVHDELGQMLTALKIDLSWTKRHLPQCEPSVPRKIESMSALIETTIRAVQRITTELRPQILDVLGLVSAIEWMAKEFESRTGIRCWLNLEKTLVLDTQTSTVFFRITQEALTNVARHAEANNIHIILKKREHGLLLEIRDDGKGITPEKITDPKSVGLIGIRERVAPLNGEVSLHGTPGNGTILSILFPREDFVAKTNMHTRQAALPKNINQADES